jgi:hypothetical protein
VRSPSGEQHVVVERQFAPHDAVNHGFELNAQLRPGRFVRTRLTVGLKVVTLAQNWGALAQWWVVRSRAQATGLA